MFQFPLQPLLNHRRHVEEKLQKEMAALQRQLDAERQRADALCHSLVNHRQRLDSMQRSGDNAGNLLMVVRHLAHLAVEVSRQEETLRCAAQHFEEKRSDLIEAVKQRKVMEKLEEKARQAYQDEVGKKEMRLINEIAIGRYNRAHREAPDS